MLDLLKDIIPVSIDILVIGFVIYVILLPFIAAWKLFKKVGIPGWKALIPVYSEYLMFKIVGMKCAVLLVIPSTVYTIFDMIFSDYKKLPNYIIISVIVLVVIMTIIDVIKAIKLGKAFGKKKGFIVGLILLGPIFETILGMGKSKYIGNYKVKEKVSNS